MNKYFILKVEMEYEEMGDKISSITIMPYTVERFMKEDIKVRSEEITYEKLINSMISNKREYIAVKVVGADIRPNSQTVMGMEGDYLFETKEVTLQNVDDLLVNYVSYPNRMFN